MKYQPRKKAILLLADGTIFEGKSIGIEGTTTGEICFNTGMTGYQEIFTDPSYFGQLMVTELREKQLDNLVHRLRESYPELEVKAEGGNSNDDQFLSSLTKAQAPHYLRHVSGVLDDVMFNLLRILDEGQLRVSEDEIIMTINGEDVTELPLVGNGNLSGEMFDWIPRFSKYPSTLM